MAFDIAIFGIGVLIFVALVVLAGIILYLIYQYFCYMKNKELQASTGRRHRTPSVDGHDTKSYKTTTDEESTVKLPTFEQILKQEEKSAYSQSLSLQPIKFTQQQKTNINAGAPNSPEESTKSPKKSGSHQAQQKQQQSPI